MASDLTVQTIRGPGSGANANQILIPSGQKVISSDIGGLVAPGHIIQVIESKMTNKITTSSTSFVNTGLSVSITPKFSTSRFLITVSADAGIATNGLDRIHFAINGMSVTALGDAGSGGVRATRTVNPRSADAGWAQTALDIKIIDTPNTLTTRTYDLQWKVNNSSYPAAMNSAYNNDASTGNTVATMIVMEIAG